MTEPTTIFSIDRAGWCEQARRVPSPHHNERIGPGDISLLVIHGISLPPGEFGGPWIDDLFLGRLDPDAHPYFAGIHQLRVSAHCLIRRDGELVQYVPFTARAWHAGVSSWEGGRRATTSPSASSWKEPTSCRTAMHSTRCWQASVGPSLFSIPR